MKLLGGKTWDCYLLKFPAGSFIEPHKDYVPNFDHHRMNIILKKAALGGIFGCSDEAVTLGRVTIFRPDFQSHWVSRIITGTRWVLSIGWIN